MTALSYALMLITIWLGIQFVARVAAFVASGGKAPRGGIGGAESLLVAVSATALAMSMAGYGGLL